MPFTTYHLGPALLLGVVLSRRVDLPTLLVASVVVDVRVALVLFGPLSGPTHGILTTVGGGMALALVLGGVVLALPAVLQRLGSPLRLADTVAPAPVFAGAAVGVLSHVVLDAILYADVQPFWPLDANPFFLGPDAGAPLVFVLCVLSGAIGLAGFVIQYRERASEASG